MKKYLFIHLCILGSLYSMDSEYNAIGRLQERVDTALQDVDEKLEDAQKVDAFLADYAIFATRVYMDSSLLNPEVYKKFESYRPENNDKIAGISLKYAKKTEAHFKTKIKEFNELIQTEHLGNEECFKIYGQQSPFPSPKTTRKIRAQNLTDLEDQTKYKSKQISAWGGVLYMSPEDVYRLAQEKE